MSVAFRNELENYLRRTAQQQISDGERFRAEFDQIVANVMAAGHGLNGNELNGNGQHRATTGK